MLPIDFAKEECAESCLHPMDRPLTRPKSKACHLQRASHSLIVPEPLDKFPVGVQQAEEKITWGINGIFILKEQS
jgi:hypothetical protein